MLPESTVAYSSRMKLSFFLHINFFQIWRQELAGNAENLEKCRVIYESISDGEKLS